MLISHKIALAAGGTINPPGAPAWSAAQVQSHSAGRQMIDAFSSLAIDDQELLAFEMALSGLHGQYYTYTATSVGQPALLIYYSPAFLRGAVRRMYV